MERDLLDAVVVGAGPAGAAAATTLARAGRRVVLLDRAAFPRDKPCGDLIGVRALAMARRLGVEDSDLAPFPRLAGAMVLTDRRALDLASTTRFGRAALAGCDARVIPRAIFDTALVQAAQRAGADFRQVAVRRVAPWDTAIGARQISGTGPGGSVTLRARVVVIAGGYGCRPAEDVAPVRRDGDPPRGIAIRSYFRDVDAPVNRIAFCLNDWVLPGYGWVFPLPDGQANVGVGALTAAPGAATEHLHDLFARFVADPASPAAPWLAGARQVGTPRTWPLDLGPRRRRLVADGLLVAGEAAALVGPLTGAGIAFALASGALAGENAAIALALGDTRASNLGLYGRTISRRMLPRLRAELAAQRWLSDPARLDSLVRVVGPLPPTGVVGARLLLHLG